MSTTTTIINDAFREGNIIAVGTAPTVAEFAEGLSRLNIMLRSLFATTLIDWYAPNTLIAFGAVRTPYTPDGVTRTPVNEWTQPPPNVQIASKITEAATIYFPANPENGAQMALADVGGVGLLTLDGNGRKIQGVATITELAPAEFSGRKWLYRADLGNWILLATLLVDEEVPLPDDLDDLMITGLFLRLAPRFGIKQIEPDIYQRHADMLAKFKARYAQRQVYVSLPDLSSSPPLSMQTGLPIS